MAILNLKYGYDSNVNGLRLIANGENSAFVTYLPKQTNSNGEYSGGSTSASKGTSVTLTGVYMYYSADSYLYYYTKNGSVVILIDRSNGNYVWDGWNANGYGTKSPTYSDRQAQSLVKAIINNDIVILQNNLVCARFANKYFTESQQKTIVQLQKRVDERNKALQSDGLCTNIVTSHPSGYSVYEDYLQNLINRHGVGMATWLIVVIAAAIVTGAGTAAYLVYKKYYDESEQDVKYSRQLMAILSEKLTPEEYEQLKRETQGIVTKAKIKQAAKGYTNALLIAAAIVGGAFLYRFIKNN